MKRYAVFHCENVQQAFFFNFITLIQIEEWDLFPPKVGDVTMFYLAEVVDDDKNGKTPVEKLEWEIVGTSMKLKHGKENVYLLMDQ